MGHGRTVQQHSEPFVFTVAGTASDFLSDIDPYLLVFHDCDGKLDKIQVLPVFSSHDLCVCYAAMPHRQSAT